MSMRSFPFRHRAAAGLTGGGARLGTTRAMATAMLLGAAFFWGSGNVANETVLSHLEPLTAVGLRCAIAAVVLVPLAMSEIRRHPGWGWLSSAICVSMLFAGALVLQQIAFMTTTVTNVSFLINTCSIMTPVIAWLALGERAERRTLVALGATLAGAFLMAGASLSLSQVNRGDLLCVIAAAAFAGWMVALGQHAVRYGRTYCTALIQFVVGAVMLLPLAGLLEDPTLAGVRGAWRELLFLGLFSTGVAIVLQTHAQQYVSASRAAVLSSAESLFGAAGGYIIMGDRLAMTGIGGAALILSGILIAAGRGTLRPEFIWFSGRKGAAQTVVCGPEVIFLSTRRLAKTGYVVENIIKSEYSAAAGTARACAVQHGPGE